MAISPVLQADQALAARKKDQRTPSRMITQTPQGELLISVSIAKQRVKVYDATGEIGSSRISSGRDGFNTPTGVFSLLEKNRHHVSNLYGASMPFMQRLTWSGIALHSGDIPGYRASHGCIRLPHSFAGELFGTTSLGARVVVTHDEATPQSFSDGRLLKPLPAQTPVQSAGFSDGDAHVIATNATANDMAAVLGVTPANAATGVVMQRPRSRAEIADISARNIAALEDAMNSAQKLKDAATEAAKVSLAKANAALEALDAVKAEGKAATKAVASSEAGLIAAERKLVNVMRGARSNLTGERLQKAAAVEMAAEDAVLAAVAKLDEARAAAKPFTDRIAAAQKIYDAAFAEKAQAVSEVKATVGTLRAAQTALIEGKRREAKKALPVTVLISFKSSKVFARQGLEPIFEAPITILPTAEPRTIGTHVLTAMSYTADGDDLNWRLVTAAPPKPIKAAAGGVTAEEAKRPRKSKAEEEVADLTTDGAAHLRDALARIQLPEDVNAQISELLKPGSTVMVADSDPSFETGKGTDIVLLTTSNYKASSGKKPRSRSRATYAQQMPRYYRPAPRGWFFY